MTDRFYAGSRVGERGMGRLDRKVALITGGNVRAIALAFHREGASVVIGYVAKKKEAESRVRAVELEGGEARGGEPAR